MNRKIKFRGKDLCKKCWRYGSLIQKFGIKPQIVCKIEYNGQISYSEYFVERDSVGQFTGLKDKNGREIYEGDIIGCQDFEYKHLIFYNENEGRFMAGLYGDTSIYSIGVCGLENRDFMRDKEVIGNIHDNPELLKME